MTINLADHLDRKKLTLQIWQDVEQYSKECFAEEPRTHLGASVIGDPCQAKSWNTFRWLHFEDFSGRMRRLFNRGHEEEKRFIRWLEGIGFEVREVDPDTQEQYRISGVNGHFGGSLDSIIKPPERYNIPAEHLIWLGEFKTYNEKQYVKLAGKKPSWRDIDKGPRTGGAGVKMTKPEHYRQMCSYGRAYGFSYGLYCAVNKDTDELYYEIVPLNWHDADDLFRKAEIIINSQRQPPKIAQTETYFDCKFCDYSDICHKGELPTKNCRSCAYARPVENKEWYCDRWNNVIPKDYIPQGCEQWFPIINGDK